MAMIDTKKNSWRQALCLILCLPSWGLACTSLGWQSAQGPFFGRNFDWDESEIAVVVNVRGAKHRAQGLAHGQRALTWQARYGSVTLDMWQDGQPNRAAVVDGLNEKGLSAAVLELGGSRYPGRGKQQAALGSAQWVQYVVDHYAFVTEMIAHVKEIPVVASVYQNQSVPLHYVLHDATGDTAVIEYRQAKVRVYHGKTLPLAVLTNTPYPKALALLKSAAAPTLSGFDSKARFVRAADFVHQMPAHKTGPVWQQVSHLFVGLSLVAEPAYSAWPTTWQAVRRYQEPTYYLRSLNNQRLRWLSLARLDFNQSAKSQFVRLDQVAQGSLCQALHCR